MFPIVVAFHKTFSGFEFLRACMATGLLLHFPFPDTILTRNPSEEEAT